MSTQLTSLDRRKFLRGVSGFALALPCFETLPNRRLQLQTKRLACFYSPTGSPCRESMILRLKNSAGSRTILVATFNSPIACALETLRDKMTVVGGMLTRQCVVCMVTRMPTNSLPELTPVPAGTIRTPSRWTNTMQTLLVMKPVFHPWFFQPMAVLVHEGCADPVFQSSGSSNPCRKSTQADF